MGSPPEEEKEKEEEEKEEEVELVVEGLDSIRQEVLSTGIELNVAPPMDIGEEEPAPVLQEAISASPVESPVQMAIPAQMAAPSEAAITTPPPRREPAKPRDKTLVKADELMAKAREFTREYKYEAALQQLNSRINLLKKTKYLFEYAQTLFYAGHILNIIKKSDEAKALLGEGIEKLKGSKYENASIVAKMKVELGIAHQNLGNYESALEEFTQAGAIFKENGQQTDYINSLWNKGITYYNMQDWKNAVELYLEIARESAQSSTEMTSRLRSLQKISDLIQMVGKRGEGAFDSTKYFEEMDKLKIDYEQALAHEVRRITKGGHLEHLQAEQARDPANLALWHFNLAAAEITAPSGDISSAENHYNKSIELYKEIGDRLGLSRCYEHLAFIREKQGQVEAAVDLLRKCIESREDLKETLKTEEYRTAMQAEIIPIYDRLCYLEAHLQHYEASLNAIEQSKSRELINFLASENLDACPYVSDLLQEEEKALDELRGLEGELLHFRMRYSEVARRGGTPQFEDKEKLEKAISKIHTKLQEYRRNIWMKCIDSGNVKPPIQYDILSKVVEIFNTERHWAILEFIWNPSKAKIMVYYITPTDMKLFLTDLTQQELATMLKDYKNALIDGNEKGLQNSADTFSKKIIPTELFAELDKAEKVQYLFIIPHKELHSIPFEIIQHKNWYWGQKYALVKNFSLDLSRITLQKRIEFLQKHPKIKNSALIAGNPTMDLINAEVEAREVEHMLSQKGFKTTLLLKKKSKEETFVKSTSDQTIIHFAGHGAFITPEPILSHLQFSTSALTAREITQLKLKNIPIVILSACETAIPGILGGNELVGFVRSFILAGSTTLVSTNWPVSDVSARELIEKFYEFLLMGASVGISLQKARQAIAQKYNNQIIHWAAYTLFGDPFRKLLY